MFGNEIRSARKAQGMTQLQLSKKVNCSNQVLSEIERGKCNPSIDLLNRICNELGLQIALKEKGAVENGENRQFAARRPSGNL